MHYVVTGANGFVGRYLCKLLVSEGHQVTGFVRTSDQLTDLPVEEVVVDAKDRAAMQEIVANLRPDGIFHLAAPVTSVGYSWKHPAETLADNVEATISLFEAVRELKPKATPKVLFVSSAEVLGNQPLKRQPIDETVLPEPQSPYALSKWFGEQAAEHYFQRFGMQVTIVRPFNHIGPGQRASFVLPSFARQIAEIERTGEGNIEVGNLDAQRDFTDVRDMVKAYALIMERGEPGEVYHAGTGVAYSIKDLLELLLEASPATIRIVEKKELFRPNDIPLLVANSKKLQQLGWEPAIPLQQTIRDVLDDARQHVKKEEQ